MATSLVAFVMSNVLGASNAVFRYKNVATGSFHSHLVSVFFSIEAGRYHSASLTGKPTFIPVHIESRSNREEDSFTFQLQKVEPEVTTMMQS